MRLSRAHASAKRWERRSPERLGINAQVGDLFHDRLDTSGRSAKAEPESLAFAIAARLGPDAMLLQ